jgi:hypothetical protein
MGRPPIGKVAMTGAERVRRYRRKHAADKPPSKPATDTMATAALKAELAAAQQRIAELEQGRTERAQAKSAEPKPSPEIDPASLPKSYRERFEAMCRRQEREYARREREFEGRVRQAAEEQAREVFERMFGAWRESFKKAKRQIELFEKIYTRAPIMTKKEFELIHSCIHPDSRLSVSDEKLHRAFLVIDKRTHDNKKVFEIALCGREAAEQSRVKLPDHEAMRAHTPAEWEALKAKAAARKKGA